MRVLVAGASGAIGARLVPRLAGRGFFRKLDRAFAVTSRLRTEGTDALLDAAREAGVHRVVAQSVASFRYAREGGWAKTQDDPLDPKLQR